mmetsp:Transcript_24669/g.30189  ORF Transcript_24669/g.30189 Transcript_24669/m.30189 type:complete len:332 (+) Transcript_24669:304-1299(+)
MEKLNLGWGTKCEEVIQAVSTLPGNNIDSLKEATTIITGANTGIGKETAFHISGLQGQVILACRNTEKAEKAAKAIRKRHGKKQVKITCLQLDLSSLENVKSFVDEYRKLSNENGWPPLKCMILNAGLFPTSGYAETVDGYERTFAVNHLGHFLLTNLLLPDLRSAAPSRVVVVSSGSHYGPLVTKEITSEEDWMKKVVNREKKNFKSINAYGTSKLCNVLFAQSLCEKEEANGITTASLHPGSLIATDIARENLIVYLFHKYVIGWFTKSVNQGSSTTVTCSVLPPEDLKGQYFSDCKAIPESKRATGERGQNARDLLWKISEDLCRSYL